MTGEVRLVQTEDFINKHPNYEQKCNSIVDGLQQAWDENIPQYGDYGISVKIAGEDSLFGPITIPEDELTADDVTLRLIHSRNYLNENRPFLMKDLADAVIVVDYLSGNDDGQVGEADEIGTAGTDSGFAALIDTYQENAGELPPALQSFGSEGAAFHELLHLYGAKHENCSNFVGNPSYYTAIWTNGDPDNIQCAYRTNTADIMVAETSDCTTQIVRSHAEENGLI